MKFMKHLLATTTVAVAIVGSVTAPSANAGDLTYAAFLDSCKNPGTYGAQRPPQNVRVACKNVQTSWEPIEAGGASLGESRSISSELFSDKYHVVLESFVIEIPEFNVSCPRYREITETSQIDKSLTCAQVIDDSRGLKEICLDAINEAIAANPDLVVSVPTGRTFSTCGGTTQKP